MTCGVFLHPVATFCSNCGAPVASASKSNRSFAFALTGAVVAALVLVFVVGRMMLSPSGSGDEVLSINQSAGDESAEVRERDPSDSLPPETLPDQIVVPAATTPITVAPTAPPAAGPVATSPPPAALPVQTVPRVIVTQAPTPEYVEAPSTGSLHRGHKGSRVVDLQRLLRDWGYNVSTDGLFGPGTEDAVIDFQRSQGLEADGYAGPNTLDALYSDFGDY
jgi:hypothetical protein